jgi:hypothetical protein
VARHRLRGRLHGHRRQEAEGGEGQRADGEQPPGLAPARGDEAEVARRVQDEGAQIPRHAERGGGERDVVGGGARPPAGRRLAPGPERHHAEHGVERHPGAEAHEVDERRERR